MGSAASSLSAEQATELTKLMKEEYEKHPTSTEEEIRNIMISKYNDSLVKVLQDLPSTATGVPKGSANNTPGKQRAKITRRRSFGQETKKKTQMTASSSTPVIDPTVKDNETEKRK